jgi:hypothetical protein
MFGAETQTQAVAGDQAVIAGLSEHRHLDRLTVREQRQRPIAVPQPFDPHRAGFIGPCAATDSGPSFPRR